VLHIPLFTISVYALILSFKKLEEIEVNFRCGNEEAKNLTRIFGVYIKILKHNSNIIYRYI